MKATVAERGQVTIPKILRDQLGIRSGTVLEFEIEEGRLVARKQVTGDAVKSTVGCLRHLDKTSDELIEELRGKP